MSEVAHRFRPFKDVSWPKEKAEAAAVMWEWRDQLSALSAYENHGQNEYEKEAERIEKGESPLHIPAALADRMRVASRRHDLPMEWFLAPLRIVHRFNGSLRLADATALKTFLSAWAIPHANLLAKLAGVAHSWQLKQVAELATAFFLTDRLIRLPQDLGEDRLFIPESDLEQAGVTREMLAQRGADPAIKKMLWKQVVRIRDAYAQGQPLVFDLERRYRRPFKRNWLTGLELINEVERRKYDVWSAPIQLSGVQRFQVQVLSWIGKGAGRARG